MCAARDRFPLREAASGAIVGHMMRGASSIGCMSRAARLAVAVATVAGAVAPLGGCKGKKADEGGASRSVVRADAAGPADAEERGGGVAAGDPGEPGDGPDEATLRAGKRTGLGAGDEPAEVATEALVEAMLAGKVPWTRWIDATRGVVELRLPVGDGGDAVVRRCGAALTSALATLTTAMTTARASGAGYELACDNLGLVEADPDGALSAAVCSLESAQPGTIIVDVVFVPDAARGLRLVGMSTIPSEADATAALEAFEPEMGRADARCP